MNTEHDGNIDGVVVDIPKAAIIYEPNVEPPVEEPPVEAEEKVDTELVDDLDADLVGKHFLFEHNGKNLGLRLVSVTEAPPDTIDEDMMNLTKVTGTRDGEAERSKTVEEIETEMKFEVISNLVPESTNGWLYIADSHVAEDADDGGCERCIKNCTDSATNQFIATFVICIQCAAYVVMTWFLGKSRMEELNSREENCYGPNCQSSTRACMSITTGGLTSVLLVGFLWADVVNTFSLMCVNKRWFIASILVLLELFTAIICGFLVGIFSESDFDAIGGAVGILFVHDLDEKVYASMQVFRERSHATLKKVIALSLWIILSVVVAVSLACHYHNGAFVGDCLDTQFKCGSGECVWEGFVCNGVSDCSDESDEFDGIGKPHHDVCDYSLITCPGPQTQATYDAECVDTTEMTCPLIPTHFMCESDGACIGWNKRCNGVIDCEDGSDEGRAQNCQTVISKIKCSEGLNITTLSDGYTQKWGGKFKCNNGQCIDAAYACDGVPGDCVDDTDEYPNFNKARESPWLVSCPYDKLISCSDSEVLCKADGRCISKSAVCDGTVDCSDGADEKVCEYSCTREILTTKSKFQCGGRIASINSTHLIDWIDNYTDSTNLSDYTRALTSLTNSNFTELFSGVTGRCIPVSWRCDGTNDCDDGTDEQLCSLFACGDNEYQCSDDGQCIPKSWLCDDYPDCTNGEDEETAICQRNGINPSSNACITQGFFYQCSSCPTCCLDEWNMCDGIDDCPDADDEVESNCNDAYNAASATTTSFAPGGSGSAQCGDILTGTIGQYEERSYSFTWDSGEYFKIATCNSDNEGPGYMVLTSQDGTDYWYFEQDYDCPCYDRALLTESVVSDWEGANLVSGQTYILEFYAYFSGNFKITIECGSTSFSGGGTCVDQGSFGTTSYFDLYNNYNHYYDTTTGGGSTTAGGYTTAGGSTTAGGYTTGGHYTTV